MELETKILILKGDSEKFKDKTLTQAELAYITDTKKVYIGVGGEKGEDNVLLNPTLGTAAEKDTGTAAGNVVEVDSDGKIATSLIPSTAITDVFVVNTQAERLALPDAHVGDVVVQLDVDETYILQVEPATEVGSWVKLQVAAPVASVAGKTGVVTLEIEDIDGLETALLGKADLTGATFTGNVSAPTQDITTNNDYVATTKYVNDIIASITTISGGDMK